MKRFLILALFVVLFSFSAFADCSTSTLTFQTEAIPAFFVGEQQSFQIEAVGGNPPYKFEVLEEFGPLPADLKLTPSGRLHGKAEEETLGTTVFIRLSDADGCVVNQAFNIQVEPAQP